MKDQTSLQAGSVERVGVGHLRIVRLLPVWGRYTAGEMLGVLATWAPETAMLPLPLALKHCRPAACRDAVALLMSLCRWLPRRFVWSPAWSRYGAR